MKKAPSRHFKKQSKPTKQNTSWQKVSSWYDDSVGEKGHYYHQNLILPNLLPLLKFGETKKASLLDLGCGQGILSRHIPSGVSYTGCDYSRSLISQARERSPDSEHRYFVRDVTEPLNLEGQTFTHAAMILSIQNIKEADKALENAAAHLVKGGRLAIVLNHPCYRIPRQTHWEVDQEKQIQYRRIDRYMSPLAIPIQLSPSKGKASVETYSFHRPLSFYIQQLSRAGLLVEAMEEWCSDKTSTGGAAKMENRARKEFPLFLCLVAVKV